MTGERGVSPCTIPPRRVACTGLGGWQGREPGTRPRPAAPRWEVPFCRVCALDSFPRFTWKPPPKDGVLPAPGNTKQTNQPHVAQRSGTPGATGARNSRGPGLGASWTAAHAGGHRASLTLGNERRLLVGTGTEPAALSSTARCGDRGQCLEMALLSHKVLLP